MKKLAILAVWRFTRRQLDEIQTYLSNTVGSFTPTPEDTSWVGYWLVPDALWNTTVATLDGFRLGVIASK